MIDQDTIKQFAWHLKVMGAYVQEPSPAVVGLQNDVVIASNDAASLYPTSIIYQNIGYDTIRDRVYDENTIRQLLNLIENVFKSKKNNPAIINSALLGFTNALQSVFTDYTKRKTIQKKKEALEFTLEYYPELLKRILTYDGNLEDILEPKDDKTYVLLKSCLLPLLEAITWLSPQNRGYNQTIVEYVFFHDKFLEKPRNFYIVFDVNSTKTRFKKLEFEEGIQHFKTRVLNPYGILFDKHEDNLAYDVQLLIESLSKRRIVKDQMLVLEAIKAQLSKIPEEKRVYFLNLDHDKANELLDLIGDPLEIREKRIQSLLQVDFKGLNPTHLKDFLNLRASQLNIVQKGIKVAANSAYGIFGLITWPFASPLIGNSITSAGKIYGIKVFQAVSVEVLSNLKGN